MVSQHIERKDGSYKESVSWLYSLQKFGIKFGLSKTSRLLKAFGSPHLGQQYIHIARDLADKRDLILITGFLFTVGEAKSYLDPIRCPIEDI